MSEPLIRLRGITKVYGQGATALQALKGVNLDIEAGDFVAIMGPSGSGKSTAMNTLGGLDTPTTGEYLFQGIHVETLTRDQRARLRRRYLGFVFQGFNLLARTSAQENVELPLLLTPLSKAQRKAHVLAALQMVSLSDRMDHYPNELSGGQQQRVAIARALVTDPTLIVADEPTGDLDRVTAGEVLDLLDELHRTLGKTIVMVTHDPKAAARAHRLVHLEKGELVPDEAMPQATH